ncbi:MAG: TolB family protein, partial [Planctomycetaceae bacterium]
MSLYEHIARWGTGLAVLCVGLSVRAQTADSDITETNPAEARVQEERLVTRVRQLTFEGRRAGESYFSADGRQMIFQSEREPGNPFFQIYLLDLESGDTQRISPGTGK